MPQSKPRLCIRPKVYRDLPGFLIYGRNTRGQSIRIFTTTLASAQHIKAKVTRGEQTTVDDFKVGA